MATLTEVKQWKPDALGEIATTMQRRLDVLVHSGDDFRRVLPVDGWTGAAADGAGRAHSQLMGRVEKMAASVGFAVKGLKQAADAIPPVQREIANLDSLAQKYSFRIGDNGVVTDLLAGKKLPPDMHPQDRAQAKQQISDGAGQALRVAEDIGHDLTDVLQRAQGGEVPIGDGNTVAAAAEAGSGVMALTTPPPPEHGTPQQNAAWWASLSNAEKNAAINDPINRIGNADGIPSDARSKANMHALPSIKKGLQERIDELRSRLHPTYSGGDYQTRAANHNQAVQQQEIRGQIDDLQGKMDALDKLGGTVTQSAGLPTDQRYYLLGVDGDGSGKAILAKGNPDTAQNVATFVPGTGSKLANLPGGTQPRADAMWRVAARSGASTSVITWQGYDSPPDIPDAASTSYADNGKGALDRFQQGLRETHHGAPSHNTVIGHSYGTTLIGHAARDGNIAADDLVFAGSPGVGVDHADQLHVPPDHVYATEARNDMIRMANMKISSGPGDPGTDPILGPDPTDKDFGGRTFGANDGTPGSMGGVSSQAHSEYWDPTNPSLVSMGRIINGQPPA